MFRKDPRIICCVRSSLFINPYLTFVQISSNYCICFSTDPVNFVEIREEPPDFNRQSTSNGLVP